MAYNEDSYNEDIFESLSKEIIRVNMKFQGYMMEIFRLIIFSSGILIVYGANNYIFLLVAICFTNNM